MATLDGTGIRMNVLRDLDRATKEQVTMFHNDGRRTIITEDYQGRVSVVQVKQDGRPMKSGTLRDVRL